MVINFFCGTKRMVDGVGNKKDAIKHVKIINNYNKLV